MSRIRRRWMVVPYTRVADVGAAYPIAPGLPFWFRRNAEMCAAYRNNLSIRTGGKLAWRVELDTEYAALIAALKERS